MSRQRLIIVGAAGRDFHNFNMVYRDNPACEVVAFTAAQIPGIAARRYPAELAGEHYPQGIPIVAEPALESMIEEGQVSDVVFSYSDVSHRAVMHVASRVLAAGANFTLLGPKQTMLTSSKPVIGVLATRTGTGKSQVSRYIARELKKMGKRVIAIRHPMPYGQDLRLQRVERFATREDFDRYQCTIEEREEYEAYLELGFVVYAGVDYEAVLREAETEADVILWDGGNNDLPFIRPDLWITVADPLRSGHETLYHPGETNFRAADVLIINKVNTATKDAVALLRDQAQQLNPDARVILTASVVSVEDPEMIKGKRVLCVEDGPTLTHGEMSFGAGFVAAEKYGAAEIVDPRPWAVGSLAKAYEAYPHMGRLVPALGYYPEQLQDLEKTIAETPCDMVLIATPIDLQKLIQIPHPCVRVRYELEDWEKPHLNWVLQNFVEEHVLDVVTPNHTGHNVTLHTEEEG